MDADEEKMHMMLKAFQMFDHAKEGLIETTIVANVLKTMNLNFDKEGLARTIDEYDRDKTGKINFDGFAAICSDFLDEEDDEAMQNELREAFRMYDKEGNGYITTKTLREILAAIDDKLTDEDLDGMIEEIDSEGSGKVDVEGFVAMMTSS